MIKFKKGSEFPKKMTKIFRKDKTILVLTIIVSLLMVFFIIRPAIIGYSIYGQVQKSNYSIDTYANTISQLKSKLELAKNNITAVKEFNSQLISINLNCSEKYSSCLNNNFKTEYQCNSSLKEDQLIINNLKSQLNATIARIDGLRNNFSQSLADEKAHYATLAKKSADNICCKKKIDNSNINYYIIQDDQIICLETSGFNLSCTS